MRMPHLLSTPPCPVVQPASPAPAGSSLPSSVNSATMTTGQRVRRARLRRGMSQEVLAGFVDRSVSWLSKVENGHLPLDRMSVVIKIAGVLHVDVSELLGQPYRPASSGHDSGQAYVPAIRHALLRYDPGRDEVPASLGAEPPDLRDCRGRVDRVLALRQASRYAEMGRMLPSLIDDLQAGVVLLDGAQRETAQRALTETLHAARMMVKHLGYADLALVAAERAAVAAAQVGDPRLVAANAWERAHVLLSLGALAEARDLVLAAAALLEPDLAGGEPEVLSLWGSLHMRAAIALARLDDSAGAWSHMRIAEEAGRRIELDRNDFQTVFGPTNVAIQLVAVATELAEGGEALARARHVDLSGLGSAERQAHFLIEVAHGHALCRHDAESLRALFAAERVAPEHIHNHAMVRELLRAMLNREHHSISSDLQELAGRMGVL
jgi:transcriptional regulator with XRE-family HTH domain